MLKFLVDRPLIINISNITSSNDGSNMAISLDELRKLKKTTFKQIHQRCIKDLYDNVISTISNTISNTTNNSTNTITIQELLLLSFDHFQLLYSNNNTTTNHSKIYYRNMVK